MAPIMNVKKMKNVDLGALLDMKDSAVVTLEAGETRLAAHRAVLAARSPVFQAMFQHDTVEASTGQVSIPDVEGPVLRQLLSYCYTLQAPQLPAIAPQLLAAADKYGLLALKSECEQQVVAQLANENAAASAVLGVRHSCPNLTAAAVAFIREHDLKALASQGWADAMLKQPADLIEFSQLLAEPSSETRMDRVTPSVKIKDKASVDLSALLDAGDNAMVTIVVGETQLVAHRAVLAARSPVLEAMFHSDTLKENSGQVPVPDMEGPVLRQLLAYCYTLQAPEDRCTASQLLVAADRYGLSSLKAACERQVSAHLTVRNAAAAAVLAVRHSCPDLTVAAVAFIKAHLIHVLGTQYWADMMRNHPEELIKVSQLLAEPPAEIKSLSAEEKGKRLIEAAEDGELEELWVLLASGADLRATDEKGISALHLAAGEGHLDVVRCLVDSGAEVDIRDRDQYTPLHFAAYGDHLAVMRFLAASSADVDARCREGRTALHWAAEAGHTGAVALLLELGADKEARDQEGKTPLEISRQENRQEVIELLTRSC